MYYQAPVVEPMGEARSDMDVITGLAEKLGITIGGEEPIRCHEDYLRKSVSATGLTLENHAGAHIGTDSAGEDTERKD